MMLRVVYVVLVLLCVWVGGNITAGAQGEMYTDLAADIRAHGLQHRFLMYEAVYCRRGRTEPFDLLTE
jgi:hypothetical protein